MDADATAVIDDFVRKHADDAVRNQLAGIVVIRGAGMPGGPPESNIPQRRLRRFVAALSAPRPDDEGAAANAAAGNNVARLLKTIAKASNTDNTFFLFIAGNSQCFV